MKRRSSLVVFSAITTLLIAPATAQAQSEPLAQPVKGAQKLDAKALQLKVSPRLSSSGTVTAFVALDRKPAVDAFDEKKSQGKEVAKQAARQAKNDVSATLSWPMTWSTVAETSFLACLAACFCASLP